jgi:hypothetical protein
LFIVVSFEGGVAVGVVDSGTVDVSFFIARNPMAS